MNLKPTLNNSFENPENKTSCKNIKTLLYFEIFILKIMEINGKLLMNADI